MSFSLCIARLVGESSVTGGPSLVDGGVDILFRFMTADDESRISMSPKRDIIKEEACVRLPVLGTPAFKTSRWGTAPPPLVPPGIAKWRAGADEVSRIVESSEVKINEKSRVRLFVFGMPCEPPAFTTSWATGPDWDTVTGSP
jgi:hypothetical protein